MPFLTVRGNRHFYRQSGHGTDVIAIHGLAGNMMGWHLSGLAGEASRLFRVTTYDVRGHGLSDTPLSGYTSDELAEDLRGLMHGLGIESAILVGHSYGAVVAMQLAARHPENVLAVVNSDGHFPGLTWLNNDPRSWPGWKILKARAAKMGINMADGWYCLETFFAVVGGLDAPQEELWRQLIGKDALERVRRLASTTCGADVSEIAGLHADRLLSLRQPVHCIYGAMSPFLETAEYLRQHLAHCVLHLLPNVEHFAFEEDPDDFLRAVMEALCDLAGVANAPGDRKAQEARIPRRDTIQSPNPSVER